MPDLDEQSLPDRGFKAVPRATWISIPAVLAVGAGMVTWSVLTYEDPDIDHDRALIRLLTTFLLIGLFLTVSSLYGLTRSLTIVALGRAATSRLETGKFGKLRVLIGFLQSVSIGSRPSR